MATTENSRADALTEITERLQALTALKKRTDSMPVMNEWQWLNNLRNRLLAASPVEQPAAAPVRLKEQLRHVMDLLDSHLGDSDSMLEGMTQEEVEDELPVVAAMQIVVSLYQETHAEGNPAAAPIVSASADERAEGADGLAHEVWSAAQLAPGEGIEDAVQRIGAILSRSPATSPSAEAQARPADAPGSQADSDGGSTDK
ncbi:hypothetical protein WI99_11590 [Burkholderia cepacia]|uniref:hypothetical protein n=1 Tax=Burkholderia cepacia TaxID=292 RepID=UPI00075EB6F5|nr:hypothetical protein [Burkholderia cepacia]KVE87767.1 hypothetical protein WI99_11590 [Burkholderia cepacia]